MYSIQKLAKSWFFFFFFQTAFRAFIIVFSDLHRCIILFLCHVWVASLTPLYVLSVGPSGANTYSAHSEGPQWSPQFPVSRANPWTTPLRQFAPAVLDSGWKPVWAALCRKTSTEGMLPGRWDAQSVAGACLSDTNSWASRIGFHIVPFFKGFWKSLTKVFRDYCCHIRIILLYLSYLPIHKIQSVLFLVITCANGVTIMSSVCLQ